MMCLGVNGRSMGYLREVVWEWPGVGDIGTKKTLLQALTRRSGRGAFCLVNGQDSDNILVLCVFWKDVTSHPSFSPLPAQQLFHGIFLQRCQGHITRQLQASFRAAGSFSQPIDALGIWGHPSWALSTWLS